MMNMEKSTWCNLASNARKPRRRPMKSSSTLEPTRETKHNLRMDSNKPEDCGDMLENESAIPSKYADACARIKENLERYIGDGKNNESSDSEEELDDGIIEKTFDKYKGEGIVDVKRTTDILQDSLTSGAVVCLICIETVKRNNAIWSCHSCYAIFHISCIQKWAKDSIFYQSSVANNNELKEAVKWCCPKCRQTYESREIPSKYYCFCGKMEDPPFDPWILPHSCGKICGKELKPCCGHECLLLCHPGSCPPCPKTIQRSCYCGKSKAVTRRCSSKEWSCNAICKHILSCGYHKCEHPCHSGACPPCSKWSEQKCNCGNELVLKPCDNPSWQCGKVCGKSLECGNHKCTLICHSNKCPHCSKSGPRTCPCGKKASRLPCTEEIPACGDTCGKSLECDMHSCNQRCHYGPCSSCLQMRIMKCRCGQREKEVPCCKEYVCEIKCKRKRDCGRHNCNRKCCAGNCPPCEAPCLRPLSCGNHKCQSRCHRGPCYPCHETVEITCNCGITKMTIPCGRKKSAVPPRCAVNCKLPPDCHHPERHKHRCHFGPCPSCRLICGKTLVCGHSCPSRCHSAVLTKVEDNRRKQGPWDLINSFKMELVCKSCPPCVVPVPYTCLGDHETLKFPCSEARPWSCGRRCDRCLPCTNHTCQLECHSLGFLTDPTVSSKHCQTCEEMCSKERPKGCFHPCPRLCHPDDCYPCKEQLKLCCHCQLNTIYIVCEEWINCSSIMKSKILSCKNRCPKELGCGHRCPFICHEEDCPDQDVCKKRITVRCPCKRLKQDVVCGVLVARGHHLNCDEECEKILQLEKAAGLAKELILQEEQKKKQQMEIEEYQRKFEGKKKKHKKIKSMPINDTDKKRYVYWTLLIAFFGMVAYYTAHKVF